MNIMLITKISIVINVAIVAGFLVKRYYYTHSGPAADEQQVYYDKYNQARKNLQESLPIDSGDVVFVGTSLTEGFPLEESFHSLKVKNRGIAGNTSEQILGRIGPIIEAQPGKLFLEAGVNDILRRFPLDTLIQHAQQIISAIREGSPTTELYVLSVFPLGSSHPAEEKEVERFNTWLKNYCHFVHVTYVDLFLHFYNGEYIAPNYTYDGIHLTGAGYEVWRERLTPYL